MLLAGGFLGSHFSGSELQVQWWRNDVMNEADLKPSLANYYYVTTAGFKSMRCIYPVVSIRETVPAG